MSINNSRQAAKRIAVISAAICGMLLAGAGGAQADFGITSFEGGAFTPDGQQVSQAGAHPDVTTRFTLPTKAGGRVTDGSLRNVTVAVPPGLVGNPSKIQTCASDDFYNPLVNCPAETQVGTITITTTDAYPFYMAVYRLPTPRGTVARFGAFVSGTAVLLDARLRLRPDGQYGVVIESIDTSISLRLAGVAVTLWGVPADPVHDALRVGPGGFGLVDTWGPVASTAPRAAFISAPTSCPSAPLVTSITATSWEEPDVVRSASFDHDTDGFPIRSEGCDRLAFAPTMTVQPTSTAPDSPTGLDVDIESPQNVTNPDGLVTAHLKDVHVTLPEGMTINPGSADGLQACTDAQLALGSNDASTCPDGSKIGTVTATSPVLSDTLAGGIYIRSQNSGDPESGEMFRVALVLRNDDYGIVVKLPGRLVVNKDTGRIVTFFDDNPQLPVDSIKLHFKSGPRAPLVTPATCGPKTIDATVTSWAGHTRSLPSTYDVPCTAGLGAFAPAFSAGTVDATGGAYSPFALSITKPDGNAPITGLSMKLPTGLLAQLKGNVGTQVGTVTAIAGPGSNPFALSGQVYLEGAYGDAPFSLRVVVPAKAGPFDLGTVEVKQKIYVDPITAQVTVVSDPLPTVVKGVPVRLQRLDVNIDKAGFIINPTSCAPKAFTGTMSAVDGQAAPINARFQASGCAGLGYTPKLAMTMSGKGQTKDGSHPALSARLTPPTGDANNKKVTVTLPLSLALDPGNANGLCDAAKNTCAANTIVGSAQAQSILPDTLKAPVYFVRGERVDGKGKVRKTLPKLFIPLTADGVTVYVTGDSDVVGDRLVTTFENLPDAPFSTFDLKINGGKHGILAVSGTNICAATQIADAEYGGQNGKTYASKVTMGTPCALGVVKSSRTSTALKLTVGGVGAGRLSASGNGVAKASTTIASATTATLSLKLTKVTRRALARGRDVKIKVKVAFTAKGQKKAKTATKTVTIHGAKKR
jgi:hypothetical protein